MTGDQTPGSDTLVIKRKHQHPWIVKPTMHIATAVIACRNKRPTNWPVAKTMLARSDSPPIIAANSFNRSDASIIRGKFPLIQRTMTIKPMLTASGSMRAS